MERVEGASIRREVLREVGRRAPKERSSRGRERRGGMTGGIGGVSWCRGGEDGKEKPSGRDPWTRGAREKGRREPSRV